VVGKNVVGRFQGAHWGGGLSAQKEKEEMSPPAGNSLSEPRLAGQLSGKTGLRIPKDAKVRGQILQHPEKRWGTTVSTEKKRDYARIASWTPTSKRKPKGHQERGLVTGKGK